MRQQFKWKFRSSFRTNAFGWKGSKIAVQRIKEAVREIRKVKDPLLRAEGAILLLERLWPATQHIDSSSGALGTATSNAVNILIQFIIDAPYAEDVRKKWLNRLWRAIEEDGVDYLHEVTERWGELCADQTVALRWADEFQSTHTSSWEMGGYFSGTPAYFSCLLQAQRYDELLKRLDQAPYLAWFYRKFGVKALAALGKTDEAIRYAKASQGLNDGYIQIAVACEAILIDAGRPEEAYCRFALDANTTNTHLARFRALAKKYPHKKPEVILRDLIASAPGEEGKWFATAKSLGQFEVAADLAHKSPVNIATLNRAARDFLKKEPAFALQSSVAALHWLAAGEFYEITGADVYAAVNYVREASKKVGCEQKITQWLSELAAAPNTEEFVRQQIINATSCAGNRKVIR